MHGAMMEPAQRDEIQRLGLAAVGPRAKHGAADIAEALN
jgi:hypothetical protein